MIWAFWHFLCQVFLPCPPFSSTSGISIMCVLYPLCLAHGPQRLSSSSFFFQSLVSLPFSFGGFVLSGYLYTQFLSLTVSGLFISPSKTSFCIFLQCFYL